MKRLLGLCGVMILLASLATPAAAGGGCHLGYSDEPTATVRLEMNCFSPTVARIDPGDTVTFRNVDGIVHAVGGIGDSFGHHKELAPGKAMTFRFQDEGTFPYVCIYHPSMGGAIVVGDGEGKGVPNASVFPAEPTEEGSAEETAAVAATSDSAAAKSSSDRGWMVGAGIAIGLVLLVIAALPRRRSVPQL